LGAVLKSNTIEGLGAKVAKFNLMDIRAEAAAIIQRACDQLDRAKEEARSIVEQAKIEVEQAKTQAREEGYRSGHEQGLIEGRNEGVAQGLEQAKTEYTEQASQLRAALDAVLHTFEAERNHFMVQAHQELLALALAMAVKITRRQLQIDPEIVLENVKAAVNLVGSRSTVVVGMNPSDIDRFNLLDPEKAEKLLGLQQVKIVPNDTVEAGGCVVRTENGAIDAQVSTQLQNLIHQLAPAMEQTVKAWTSGANQAP